MRATRALACRFAASAADRFARRRSNMRANKRLSGTLPSTLGSMTSLRYLCVLLRAAAHLRPAA